MKNTEKYCSFCMSKDMVLGEIDKTFSYDDLIVLNPLRLKKRITEKNRNCM